MKVMSVKNIELKDRCPACDSVFKFKRYINGGQCNAHPPQEVCFFTENKLINKIEVIEGTNSITFDLSKDELFVNLSNEESITLPIFNMDVHSITLKTIKEMLIFK